jgi:prophage antirepressor-like protein
MDILKVFSLLENETGEQYKINIQGTLDEPLFQANQIGKILGIGNISESLKDFGEDEKVISITDTLGGKQDTIFLTELGLYRLLGRSRKPIASTFQKWMIKSIKEIRITGMYQLKSENEIDRKLMEYNSSLKTHRLFLNAFDCKNVVYLFKLQDIGDKFVLKIGHTDNIKERTSNIMNNYNTNNPILLDVFETHNNCNCEKQIRKNEFIKKFRYSENVKRNNEPSRETYLVIWNNMMSLSR